MLVELQGKLYILNYRCYPWPIKHERVNDVMRDQL